MPPIDPDTPTAPNGWSRATLTAFRAGRAEALTWVYREHAPELARRLRTGFTFESGGHAHRFGGYAGAFELQDALQETFRLAFEAGARERYDGLRPYAPYLFAIARNVVLRGFRAREVLFPTTGELALAAEAVPATSAAVTPELDLQRAQTRRLVEVFLATLTAEDRRLLTVRFAEGTPQREAAELLGMGRQRLRGREDALRARLLAHLRAHGAVQTASGGIDLLSLVFGLHVGTGGSP
jgi:RNA polymerase sigma-70 factor (ECF subfamily)